MNSVGFQPVFQSHFWQLELVESSSAIDEPNLADPVVLHPLASLKWPYVPEESAFPDPLRRDDPKVLNLSQYEVIGASFPLVIIKARV